MTRIWNKHKQTNTPLKRKVFVGISGGVDSSVAAALLKKEGYEVTGVFIKIWQPEFLSCTFREDRLDAMRACAHLDIPFLMLDLSREYQDRVVSYMLAEYAAGRTPNPDVMCNRHIKFGAFFNKAIEMGVDYIATGHYAQIKKSKIKNQNDKSKFKIAHALCQSEDKNKDQTYFLWTLTQEQLSRTLFPVGEYEKPYVRKLARDFGLQTADKKDSQGVCFVGKLDMRDFLKKYIPEKPGVVLNEQGEAVGTHEGAAFYTIGERHGFLITKKTPHDGPSYVISKDMTANTLTVSQHTAALYDEKNGRELRLQDVNWISGSMPSDAKKYAARIRYREKLAPCTLRYDGAETTVVFDQAPKAVSPGQSVVLYDGEICLGGGVIM